MKLLIAIIALLTSTRVLAQSNDEASIIKLSKQIFSWEVTNRIDSLASVFDEKFVVVSSNGESQSKTHYISRLKSGSFNHNSIEVEENTASVVDNKAIVVGKGKFTVTVSGSVKSLHLSYTEVFPRPGANKPWKILAMHASML